MNSLTKKLMADLYALAELFQLEVLDKGENETGFFIKVKGLNGQPVVIYSHRDHFYAEDLIPDVPFVKTDPDDQDLRINI